MGRFTTMMMVLLAIQACLVLYYAQSQPSQTGYSGAGVNVTTPTPWDTVSVLATGAEFNAVSFFLGFIGLAGTLTIGAIMIGSTFGFVTDFMVLAPVVLGLTTLITVIMQLAAAINSDLLAVFGFACTNSIFTCPNTWILAVTIGPLFIYYFMTIIDYWRGRD